MIDLSDMGDKNTTEMLSVKEGKVFHIRFSGHRVKKAFDRMHQLNPFTDIFLITTGSDRARRLGIHVFIEKEELPKEIQLYLLLTEG